METPVDIVLVEDEPDLLRTLDMVLSDAYMVASFADGNKAVDFLRNSPARLLITDLRMPELNGFMVAYHARQVRPDLKVLLISAYVEPQSETHQNIINGCVDAFLPKPFQYADLVELVEQLIGK